MHKRLFLFFFLISQLTLAQSKTVCFSIDDLPVVNYGNPSPEFHLEVTQKLMDGLKVKSVPAIGFVNEGKLWDKDEEMIGFQKQCLELWLEAGMDLGNHTLKHKDFNNTPFYEYAEEILLGEKVTKALLKKHGKEMMYFRHPFLHVGERESRADSLDKFLIRHNYIVAPVTIDNADYLFARAYHISRRKGDDKLADKIGEDYINYMEEKLLYYEKQSDALFNRQISQILLIHASLLNADYIEKLAAVYQKHGYKFVRMEEALKDEAYKTPVTAFGRYGISWIDRWALSAGKKGEFFAGDPATPEYIENFGR
ncbi:polysaccharide deacetylase family protein [Jiulongibacter sediminis]|uniref:Polysaccharide deacetylase-like protein n=1 Tax=Jiulongibacter sediminis TaxID=1605367 RepID=A0A0P7BR14_9BACT|nr:polysaccharide deacetylase family protein [Jiulongibacter sediminis]KPM49678.1 polysaccharide deacetylase-like protein [Jiulongibacter sediminis]TBX26715.1 polysaccharide deacetylase-like protein [Jiulongibacter sediminis]